MNTPRDADGKLAQWKALFQGSSGDLTGFMAWVLWRGAYLTKSMSWKNKLLIPVYVSHRFPLQKDEVGLFGVMRSSETDRKVLQWFVSWVFGRDISRF